MMNATRILLVVTLALTCVTGALGAEVLPDGPIVLTRSHDDAAAVWDATDELAALIGKKKNSAEIMRILEADAVIVMRDRAATLKSQAKSLTVNVIYRKVGAISPLYQVAVLTGFERLLRVKAALPAALAGNSWVDAILLGEKPPADLDITVMGRLPPPVR